MANEGKIDRSIPETCAGSLAIAKRLSDLPVGNIVEYKELSGLAGKDVRGKGAYMLQTARRILVRENNLMFGTVRGVGIKRLDDSAIADAGPVYIKQIRKSAKRKSANLGCVANFSGLPPDKKVSMLSSQTVLRFYAAVSSRKTMAQIGNAVTVTQKSLPFKATLAVFSQHTDPISNGNGVEEE